MNTNEKIAKLIKLMDEKDIDAYIIPTSDYHQSEYIADYFKTREWISGFTGSYGTVVITKEKGHGLWTDGRYFIQAEKQISGSKLKLFKERTTGTLSYDEWLNKKLDKGSKVGLNGKLFSIKDIVKMKNKFEKNGIDLITNLDLVDEIWEDRTKLPKKDVLEFNKKYAGKSRLEKLEEIREEMKGKDADCYVVTDLADIAWIYNLRGNDVKHNPVFLSYTLIKDDKAYLYVDKDKFDEKLVGEFENNDIILKDYDVFYEDLNKVSNSKVLIDPEMTNYLVNQSLDNSNEIKEIDSIVTLKKAKKNKTEIKHFKNAHVKDGVAMVEFFYWLENELKNREISEVEAANKLNEFRKKQELYMDDSFAYISGYASNGAIVHYKAEEESAKMIKNKGLYLIDSGGQYLDGTTDITRTIGLGKITDRMKKDFTLVLKGHINLSTAKFIEGTSGDNLDILARKALWDEGFNYNHGTGHGVGFYLNVHEGPQNVSFYKNSVKLEKGMVISNEPGLYREDKYGIRIENLIYVDDYKETQFGKFLEFKNLTLCPIDIKLIDVDLLSEKERKWLNTYHKKVYDKLSPYINKDQRRWLKDNTRRL